jgi:hypothetical protein
MWILMLGQYSLNKTIRKHVGHASRLTSLHRLACPNEVNGVGHTSLHRLKTAFGTTNIAIQMYTFHFLIDLF